MLDCIPMRSAQVGTKIIVVNCDSDLSSFRGCVVSDQGPSWQTSTVVAERVRWALWHVDRRLACPPRKWWGKWETHLELFWWRGSGPHCSWRSRPTGWSHQTSYTTVAVPVSGRIDSSWVAKLDVPGRWPQSLSAAPYRFPPIDHHGGMSFSHLAESTPNLSAATSPSMKWRVAIFTSGEKISSKPMPYSCRNPFATNLALYIGVVESDVSFSR